MGVQLADMMAGTLGYIFDELKKSNKSSDFEELIKDKLISLNQFPKEYKPEKFNERETFSEYDTTIATLGLNRVFDFIDKTVGNTPDNRDRINFLKLLLLYHQSNHPRKFTTSAEFIRHLSVNRSKPLSKEQFSSKLIGHLRDKGILIASSRDGYKIPTSASDMKKYINHGKNIVIPILRRIEECRNSILLATTNEYDILNDPEYQKLRDLIEAVD